jgi:phenylalanyl-tRNA synthetase beta chain
MGGFDTMITDRTRNILVESAWFDPLAIRQSSKRHGLHTDASHRFERGADYGATQLACARVAERILGSSGGQLAGEELDRVARTLDQAPVALRISEVRRILGRQLPTHEVVRILTLLGFELVPEPGEEPEFVVRIPSWRMDIEREIDLIEELARLHGYDQFANTLPVGAGAVVDPPEAAKQQKLRSSLLALGFDEGLSTTFISHADAEQFSAVPVVELENPLSEEASVLRSSMLPGVLKMLDYNLNRGNSRVRLFEMGSVFEASGLDVLEKPRAGLGATGSVDAPGFAPGRPLSFFDLKGDLENLLHPFAHQTLTFEAPELDYLHPGLSARARMDGIAVAEFGQLHPALGAAHKLRQDVFVAEIFLDVLYRRGLRELRYQALPRYPAVERDLSFVFSDAVRFAAIEQAVSGLGLNELHSFTPVEVFRGSGIPNGAYSLLLRAKFQSRERTLREEEVSRWISALIEALEKLGGAQRA